MTTAIDHYRTRMQRVLDHIDQHPSGDLDLDAISGIAAFSKFHFHRQFTAIFGLSVYRYVQLARLKRASHQLVTDRARSVTDIALEAGYDAPDAFARAFRARFAQSPSAFRKAPDWTPWLAAFAPVNIARRKAAGLSPQTSPTFNIFRSERVPANPADYSMDLCVGTDRPIGPEDAPMQPGVIPGGRCAVFRVVHNTHDLEPAALYLYREWLPASGEEARDFPIYCRRHLNFFPNAAVHDVVVELFLPLQ